MSPMRSCVVWRRDCERIVGSAARLWGDRTSRILAEAGVRRHADGERATVRGHAGRSDTRSELAADAVLTDAIALGEPVTGRLLATGAHPGGG